MRTAFRGLLRCLVVSGLLAAVAAVPASAQPNIDGDLTDMIAFAEAVQASGEGCALIIADPAQDISVNDPLIDPCPAIVGNYYVNGFDMNLAVIIVSGGDLYLGTRVEGVIGDPDGDGSADNTCIGANVPEQPGIGDADSYIWFLDTDCSQVFSPDVEIEVADNTVNVTGLANGGTNFAFNGSDLEVEISNVDLGLFVGRAFAGNTFDGLGEDLSATLACPPPNLQLQIDKTADPESICAGESVRFSIEVTNPNAFALDVNVEDVLPAGWSYIGGSTSGAGEPGVAGMTLTFPVFTLAAGASQVVSFDAQSPVECAGEVVNLGRATGEFSDVCVDGGEPIFVGPVEDDAVVECSTPDVEITKSHNPVVITEGGSSTVTLLIENTGTTDLDPVQVKDTLPAGVTYDDTQVVTGSCGVTGSSLAGNVITFDEFTLAAGASCTIVYEVGCAQFDNSEQINEADVTAYCAGTFPEGDPVVDSDTSRVVCEGGGEACPRTIGFWRQQCAQRGNGSTKVCLAGMENYWRCVIEATGVIEWLNNDGSTTSTAALAALSDSDLFEALCSQLEGPRPMTLHDMAEVQYLGLMLNVCSGNLPLGTPIDNGFDGTVAEAIEEIEDAINSGDDIGFWKDVADDINNREGVLAADCEGGSNAIYENLEECQNGEPGARSLDDAGARAGLTLGAYPNPVNGSGTVIRYNLPAALAGARATVDVFDVSGRLVRNLAQDGGVGINQVDWDLRDNAGAPVAAGIYFYRLRAGGDQITQRLLVVRQ